MQEEVRGGGRSNILYPPIRAFLKVRAPCERRCEEKVGGGGGWRGDMTRRREEEHCPELTDNDEHSLREWTLGNGETGAGVIVRGRRRRRRRFNVLVLNDVRYP